MPVIPDCRVSAHLARPSTPWWPTCAAPTWATTPPCDWRCAVSWPRAISWSRTTPGWARRPWPRRWPGPSASRFGRVQFTADLLPADVTGAMVFDRDSGQILFRPGPVFTNILLADELNRASPKAQSALLESMEEHQVSADGVSHPLPQPVHGDRHPEPLRRGGDVSAPPQPTRPVPAPAQPRLSRPRRRGRVAGRHADPPDARFLVRRGGRRVPARLRRRRAGARTWHPRCAATSSTSSARHGRTPTSPWVRRRGPPWRCCERRGRWRSPPAATT